MKCLHRTHQVSPFPGATPQITPKTRESNRPAGTRTPSARAVTALFGTSRSVIATRDCANNRRLPPTAACGHVPRRAQIGTTRARHVSVSDCDRDRDMVGDGAGRVRSGTWPWRLTSKIRRLVRRSVSLRPGRGLPRSGCSACRWIRFRGLIFCFIGCQ